MQTKSPRNMALKKEEILISNELIPIHGQDFNLHYPRARGDGGSKIRKPIMLLTCIVMALFVSSMPCASSQEEWILTGRVADASTGKPLGRATIRLVGWIWNVGRFDMTLTADEKGYFIASIRRGYYWILAYSDDPETPGMDYVPGFFPNLDLTERESTIVEKTIVINFELIPGASIVFTGRPEFIELGGVPEGFQYGAYVGESKYGSLLTQQSIVGYSPDVWTLLGLEWGHIIAPADSRLFPVVWSTLGYIMVDNDGTGYEFKQGSKTVLDISKATMERNVAVVRDRLTETWLTVYKLSANRIDVKAEFDDLNSALTFLNLSRLELSEGRHSQCFANLRAAYIIDEDVRLRTENVLSDVTFSPIPLSFLLVLCGFGLASVFIEKNAVRIGAGALIGFIFLGFYYSISPGWRLAKPENLLASCVFAASIAMGLTLILPRLRSDIITQSGVGLTANLTSTFSLATRNLKRRRLRSSMILVSIMTLVFGFTVFTSYQIQSAVGSGRPSTPYPKPQPPEGLMIITPPGSSGYSGLPTSIIDVLRADPLVDSVAPKTESSPAYLEAQLISETGENVTIRGVMGVSSEEVKMNDLEAAVVSGHYMAEEEHAILISARVSEMISVAPGDKVMFSWRTGSGVSATESFMVAGILDGQILEQFVDLDGQPIRPYVVLDRDKTYLSPDSIVVFNWQELISLNLGRLTRVNVQAKHSGDIVTLATQLVRKWRWYVYATIDNGVQLYYFKRDPTLSGGTAIPMLLVLVGLNVLACTLNAVYERKREIATLSLVGLNPSQVSYIFLAEAGLIAFIGGVTGYLFGLGGPRAILSLGGPGFLTEKISWTWSVAVITMAIAVTVAASVLPALKASTIATPRLPLKWKLEYLPAAKDMWLLHIPQRVSQLELRRFFRFLEGRFEEMQLLRAIPEKMEYMDVVDESDQEKEVKKLLFSHSFAQEGSRSFRTENELAATRSMGSSTYSLDLTIRIEMLYNYEPMEVVKKTASAIRKLMLQWTVTASSERWGQLAELVQVQNVSVVSKGKALLSGVSLEVMKGEIMGLTGEGRRALILAIAGLTKPYSGSVLLGGADTYSQRDEVKDKIGVLLQGSGLRGESTIKESIEFLVKLSGKGDPGKTVDDIIGRCDLKQRADVRVSNLSQKDKIKLIITQILMTKPLLLLIEDPFSGLERKDANEVAEFLKHFSNMEGMTVVCSESDEQALEFCNRILVLKNGSVAKVREGLGDAVG